ncbi:MAG: MBL fold metallo-hydrolase [Desulfobulbus oligotrophicus]|jgi:glyoxylase-like metal-dependent hydrolase (beta-lactamase superfamily II)|nr:MBL fold metallo-hydrolase [Desulfobulbus oligotrophicus]
MLSRLHHLVLIPLFIFCFLSVCQAQAPQILTQVPGYYRMQLGQFEVTALYDGATELDKGLLHHAKPEEIDQLLARMFVGNPKMQTAVNAYLINTGTHLILVDTGGGQLFGPGLGRTITNLQAAGYDTAQVDTVLLTHLHGDHVGGLTDTAGTPLFPQATIRVAQAEHDYWLSGQQAAAAPEKARAFFKIAQETAAPYLRSDRWKTFDYGPIVPGILAVKTEGHTPGHTAFKVESDGRQLLIWGDIVHSHAVQFSRPDVSIDFDVDSKQAKATRKALLRDTSTTQILVAGMHLPFPGIGRVRADGVESYAWVPIEFGMSDAFKKK